MDWTPLSNLRHAYAQLVAGVVRDQRAFADGLIAPVIRALEGQQQDEYVLPLSMSMFASKEDLERAKAVQAAPERIFLRADGSAWCSERIDGTDVEYVRADRAAPGREPADAIKQYREDNATIDGRGYITLAAPPEEAQPAEPVAQEVDRVWHALKRRGWHPGRTDDTLSACVQAVIDAAPIGPYPRGRADELLDPVAAQAPQHPDDEAVDRFAAAMKAKLAKKRADGRGGWNDKTQCSQELLSRLLSEHVEKGDPVDVGNFAMMLHQRGEKITAQAPIPEGQQPYPPMPAPDVQSSGEAEDSYSHAAVEADRKRRGEPVAWPLASPEDAAKGWTLDYSFIEQVERAARQRTEYTTSMEATEQVLIAANEVLRASQPAEDAEACLEMLAAASIPAAAPVREEAQPAEPCRYPKCQTTGGCNGPCAAPPASAKRKEIRMDDEQCRAILADRERSAGEWYREAERLVDEFADAKAWANRSVEAMAAEAMGVVEKRNALLSHLRKRVGRELSDEEVGEIVDNLRQSGEYVTLSEAVRAGARAVLEASR